jgi:hypothetical protein
MNKKAGSAVLAGLALILMSAQALAADPVVLRVIVIETADVSAYVHEVTTLTALAKNDELTRTNADLTAQMKKIASIRKIVSDSIYEEQTP